MKCPYCKDDNNRCYFVSGRKEDQERRGYYKRKRKCLSCGRGFWTIEEYVPDEVNYQETIRKRVQTRKSNQKKREELIK